MCQCISNAKPHYLRQGENGDNLPGAHCIVCSTIRISKYSYFPSLEVKMLNWGNCCLLWSSSPVTVLLGRSEDVLYLFPSHVMTSIEFLFEMQPTDSGFEVVPSNCGLNVNAEANVVFFHVTTVPCSSVVRLNTRFQTVVLGAVLRSWGTIPEVTKTERRGMTSAEGMLNHKELLWFRSFLSPHYFEEGPWTPQFLQSPLDAFKYHDMSHLQHCPPSLWHI